MNENEANPPKLTINLNTIVTTVLGAIIIMLASRSMNSGTENGRELDKISTSLPYLRSSIDKMEISLSQMVTRSEFDAKYVRMETMLDKLQAEQQRVRDELRTEP